MSAYTINNLLEASIDTLSHDGRGIATINGKTTFISGALPTETVQFNIQKTHRRYNEGNALTISSPSLHRVTAPCQHFSICGGCSMQHIDMKAQLSFKEQILLEQLKHFGNISYAELLPPLSGTELGYRRKARLGVRFVKKKNRILVGFREKNSNYLADLQECLTLHPSVGKKLDQLNLLIGSLSQFENIAQIEVAVGDNATALVFRNLVDLPAEDIQKLVNFGIQFQFHIYLQPNPPQKIKKIFPVDNDALLNYTLPEYGLTFNFHPLDFTQVNGEMNPHLVHQALTLLEISPSESVLDLFCGLGNFTLPIAKFAKQVTGIEGSSNMIERAKINAEANNIVNADFYTSNLMMTTLNEPWMKKHYDKILLDPPRTGAKEILPLLNKLNPKKIVYVSCNPATLARDAGEIVNIFNFKLQKIGLINMFPHTSHIEAIALFER